MRRGSLLIALVLLAAGLLAPPPATAEVPKPTLTTPPAGLKGHALWDAFYDLAAYGYEDQEYFVSGTVGAGVPYTTRIIVFRPSEPRDFNGTVVLDWVNVTAQFENAVDTLEAHEFLLREGYAWVHVSAQKAGVDPDYPNPLVPTTWDPVRYAAINHPGDAHAYEMFSQIARAVRDGGANRVKPIQGVQRILAAGQSQSASKLSDYVRNHQATANVIDGFLIHGTYGHDGPSASPVPVIHLESDADVATTATPHDNIALWEVAGTAHSDFWIGYHSVFGHGPRVLTGADKISKAEKEAMAVTAGNYGEQVHPMLGTCTVAGATMPMHYAVSSAISALDRWVRTGVPAPSGPKIGATTDAYGNATGGIRLAPIDHPVASYASKTCGLGGKTIPFSEAQLIAMYGSHAEYYDAFKTTVSQNVSDGWLLPEDAADLLDRACAASNRFPLTAKADC